MVIINIAINVFTAIIAGVGTYFLSHKMGKGAVYGSAFTTLVAGILFTFLDYLGIDSAFDLAAIAATAGYAGMVSEKHVENILQMMIVSIIVSLLFMLSKDFFVGIGGKLGTMAAVSCFAFIGCKKLVNKKQFNMVDK